MKYRVAISSVILLAMLSAGIYIVASDSDRAVGDIAYDQVIDAIRVELLDSVREEAGMAYDFEIRNESGYTIKKLSLKISYPFITSNGNMSNKEKIEAEGIPESIEPEDVVMLRVFVPEAYYVGKHLEMEDPELHLEGYLNKVDALNRFGKTGCLKHFN